MFYLDASHSFLSFPMSNCFARSYFFFFFALLMGEFLNYRSDFYLQSVEGMKVVCHELAQATSDEEGSVMDELVKDADRLVSCLANKVTIVS